MLALWRSPLARALHRNRRLPHARFAQLATLGLDGRPRNRTVVFRGFWPQTDRLELITDIRSAKVAQIYLHPAAELCWYFAETREQFRIQGDLSLITAQVELSSQELEGQAERHKLWQTLSESARLQFSWPSPGDPRHPDQPFPTQPPDPLKPPENFCLMLLTPLGVEHLELRGEPQNRWLYQLEPQTQTWNCQAINP